MVLILVFIKRKIVGNCKLLSKFITMLAKIYFDISNFRFEKEKTFCGIHDGNIDNVLVTISNDDTTREKYCFGKLSLEYGRSMRNYISNSAFGFSEFNILDINYKSTPSGIILTENFYQGYIEEFNRRSAHLEALITFLWFIKDNSVGLYGSYGQIPESKIVNGKSRSIVNYTCKGEVVSSQFSDKDLIKAGELVTMYSSICGLSRNILDETNVLWEYDEQGNHAKSILPKTPESFSYSKQKAIDRALHFLIIARGQNYPMYRIAYYMPIFECLFNSFGTEITFRIAQRAAYYIGETPEERKHIFDAICKGYDFRSKLFHGSELDDEKTLNPENITPLAVNLDNYLRRILVKVISDDSQIFNDFPSKLKNVFFDNPILGLEVNTFNLKKEYENRRIQAEESKKKSELKKRKNEEQNKQR